MSDLERSAKMNEPRLIICAVLWYSGVSYFAWHYIRMLRTGNASFSFSEVRKEKDPIILRTRIISEGGLLVLLAISPIITMTLKR
jgi:threonine/homoserine/homoserine lactone efflux protein